MAALRHQQIEHAILRMVLECTDHLGYHTDLSHLVRFFQPTFSDVNSRELADTLERLRQKQHLRLCKYVQGQLSCLEYPTQIRNEEECFYQGGGFRLRRTPETDPRAQELAAFIEQNTARPTQPMPTSFRPLNSFFPTADELLAAELPKLGETLLVHLNSYEGQVKQNGRLHRDYLLGMLENRNTGLGQRPGGYDYGGQQAEVKNRVMEAWFWLERQGFLVPDASSPGWHVISAEGQKLLSKVARYEHWEKLGLDQVKADLEHTGGLRVVGGPADVTQMAWEWVYMKQRQATMPPTKRASSNGSSFIAKSRIDELRKLSLPDFDFQKLVRLCEELNSSYENGNYYATAMLTRGVLDHVPPVFGHTTFTQVANNYSGGGRSFKETMQHLDGASRKVSDAHLHCPSAKAKLCPLLNRSGAVNS